MKKLIFNSKLIALSIICVFALSQQANAQKLEPGDIDVNLGLGFGKTYYSFSYSGYSSFPAITISGDYGLTDDFGSGTIGVGPVIGYSRASYDYSGFGGDYKWVLSELILGARGTYHYEVIDNLDTYGGAMLYMINYRYKYTGDYGSFLGSDSDVVTDTDVKISIFAGAKYYFTDNIAAFGEIGYSITWLTVGASLKL